MRIRRLDSTGSQHTRTQKHLFFTTAIIISFVQHKLLKINVRRYFQILIVSLPREQQWNYGVIVGELRQTCQELSSQMKTMQFLNDRNSRAADMVTEIAERSKQYENRSKLYQLL